MVNVGLCKQLWFQVKKGLNDHFCSLKAHSKAAKVPKMQKDGFDWLKRPFKGQKSIRNARKCFFVHLKTIHRRQKS